MSGGEAGAVKGQLTVMCGGDEAAFAKVEPVMQAYAKMVKRLGPAGAGQKTKMVNQICIAGVVQGLAEGIAFAEKAGLDPNDGGGRDRKRRRAKLANGKPSRHDARTQVDFGFAVEWMRKDLRIALSEARAKRRAVAADGAGGSILR